MKDIITVSAVNFDPIWGNIPNNLKRILEHVEAEAKKGVDLVVFPETALTGYDDDANAPTRDEKMHRVNAETVPGPSTNAVAELTKKYGIYVVFGMAERDAEDASKVYNAAAICGPEGVIGTNRKIHLPFSEQNWAEKGDHPTLFNTPWGPIGVGICYDFYAFPETSRFARAMGARMFINCTAIAEKSTGAGAYTGNLSLQYHAHNNNQFIVSANMYGRDVTSYFMGGSSIVGPAATCPHIYYYAGKKFEDEGADEGYIATATIDLSIVRKSFLNSVWEAPDWRPDRYEAWAKEVVESGFLNK